MRAGVWLLVAIILITGSTMTARAEKLDPAQEPTAQLRFVHGLVNAPAVDIYLDGVKIVEKLPAGEATAYGLTATGSTKVVVREAGASDGSAILEEEIELSTGLSYTFVVGAARADGAQGYLFEDNTEQHPEGEGTLRLIHLAPDQAEISAVADETAVMGLVAFGEASDRVAIGTGSPVITVIDGEGNSLFMTDPLVLQEQPFYTLFVTGRGEDLESIVISYPLTDGERPDVPVWEEVDGEVMAAEEPDVQATPEGPEVDTLPETGERQEAGGLVRLLVVYGFLVMLATVAFYWWRRGVDAAA